MFFFAITEKLISQKLQQEMRTNYDFSVMSNLIGNKTCKSLHITVLFDKS